jgi:hypothetical protein
VSFGRERNIEVKPLRSENFKLIEDGGSFQIPTKSSEWSNPIFDNFQQNYLQENNNQFDINYLNNADSSTRCNFD